MNPLVEKLLSNKEFISEEIKKKKPNCFNAIQLYYSDIDTPIFLGPEDFVLYMQRNFRQLEKEPTLTSEHVVIIWSRSSDVLQKGKIELNNLIKENKGYPFGLIIEHAFIVVSEDKIFQKRDPSPDSPYEMISMKKAIEPYLKLKGFELTWHERVSSELTSNRA